MKYVGEARRAALRLVFLTLVAVCAAGLLGLALIWAGVLVKSLGVAVEFLAAVLGGLWVLFALFTFYFFRDPEAQTPGGPGLVICPVPRRPLPPDFHVFVRH
jgi:fatty acid desaturase